MQRPPQPQSVDDALYWYDAIARSVSNHRATVLAGVRRGDPLLDTPFFAMSVDEVEAYFARERAEVDGMCIVNVVAAAEAAIRADYAVRVRGAYKHPLSRTYASYHQSLSASARVRPPFDQQGILHELKAAAVVADHLVTDFRHALRVRHWYAHGRYWLLNSTAAADTPTDIYSTCVVLLAALPK